jgi:hypothetical protein
MNEIFNIIEAILAIIGLLFVFSYLLGKTDFIHWRFYFGPVNWSINDTIAAAKAKELKESK